jgi:ATP-dependent Clp protease ATP-binding subunit ClpA
LDEGRLTDGKGSTVDFKNTFIILTSNLITESTDDYMPILKQYFKTEFLNRLDEIIVFNALKKDDIRRILDIQIARLQKRLDERHITLELDEAAHDWFAENGFSAEFGARPLKRIIVQEIENPLSVMLLDGEIADGSTVEVSAQDGKITLKNAVKPSKLN